MATTEKRWQLLLMADDGRIIPFKRIKGIAVTLVILVVLLALLCVGLGWQLSVEKGAHQRALHRLAAANRQVAHYKNEQEMTAAELVLAEARMEKAGLPVPRHQAEPPAPSAGQNSTDQAASAAADHNRPNPEPAPAPTDANSATTPKPHVAAPRAPSTAAATGTPAAAKTPAEKAAKPPVELGDLEVHYNAGKKVLRAKLRVKNTGPRSSPVAGSCVVVLKSKHMARRDWLTLPPVPLVAGKPEGKAGQSFRISNFIDLTVKAPAPKDPSAYKTASVYVFDTSGAKVMEKDFPVDLPAPAAQPDPVVMPAPKAQGTSMTTDTKTREVPDQDKSRRDDAEPVK
jgi:hypothetical protein